MRCGWIVLIMLALASLACNLPSGSDSALPPTTQSSSEANDGTTPTIVIEAPGNGSQSYVGGKVDVRVRATDSSGITRVEMRESGRIVVSQASPDPSPDFTALLTYHPTRTGTIILEVVAYRRTVVSPSATLTLTIVNSINDLDNPNALDPTTGVSTGAVCTASVRVNNLNLRAGPSTNYNVLTKLGVGEQLNVIGRNNDTTWYQVKRTNGGNGWVSADYVETNGDCSRAPVISAP